MREFMRIEKIAVYKPGRVLALVLALWCVGFDALATVYYVKTGGNDSLTGTSIPTAWASTAKVRSFAWSPGFVAGDQILFEGGSTFACTDSTYMYLQADKTKGTAASPLQIGSFGTGRATIQASSSHGLMVWVPASGTVGVGLVVTNLIFMGNGLAADGGKTYGVIVWNGHASNLESVAVADCDFSGFAGDGVLTGRDAGKGMISNVTVRHCVAYNNPGRAGLSSPSGSGLCVAGAASGLIEHCIAYSNGINNSNSSGPVGIWVYDSTGVVIQHCESYGNRTGGGDGDGFDLDGGCQNCVIQYCYSHDNDGAGYLVCQYSAARVYSNNVVRYNISQNDGKRFCGGIMFYSTGASGGLQGTQIYGNTIFSSVSPAVIFLTTGGQTGGVMRNNIFVTTGGKALVQGTVSTNEVLFQGNCYWPSGGAFSVCGYASLAEWRSAKGQELLGASPVGFNVDPRLTAPGLGGTIDDTASLASLSAYKLQSSSPMINAGLSLPVQVGVVPGSNDYFGTSIPQGSAYDIGAYEWPIWAITAIQGQGNEFVLSWQSVSGKVYAVTVSTNLVTDLFVTKIVENLYAVSTVITCTDTVNRAGAAFYRVQTDP